MRGLLTGILMVAVVFAGGYFYKTASAVCDVPLAYRIGVLDPDFELTQDEARSAVSDAESLWEDATGRNLFTYDDEADFTINFIFDSRQEYTEIEHELTHELEEKKYMSEKVREEYEMLLNSYNELIHHYERQTNAYNERLHEHNAEVERWNNEGGAPESVYQTLATQRQALEGEREDLNDMARELSQIAKEINALGERGNTLVRAYNGIVSVYNNTFSTDREFTQGDYQGDSINIYQYKDGEELRLVLAHEFGHALSLGHVENERSILHYLMGGQDLEAGLTAEDLTEFERVCGDSSSTL